MPHMNIEKLSDLLVDADMHSQLVRECVELIDQEVREKSGLSGLAIKGAYHVIKKIKPGIINHAVQDLLPEFLFQLEPFYADFVAHNKLGSFSNVLVSAKNDVAEALLSVTDARAAQSTHETLKKTYSKLRPSAKEHVMSAVPRVGQLLNAYVIPYSATEQAVSFL